MPEVRSAPRQFNAPLSQRLKCRGNFTETFQQTAHFGNDSSKFQPGIGRFLKSKGTFTATVRVKKRIAARFGMAPAIFML